MHLLLGTTNDHDDLLLLILTLIHLLLRLPRSVPLNLQSELPLRVGLLQQVPITGKVSLQHLSVQMLAKLRAAECTEPDPVRLLDLTVPRPVSTRLALQEEEEVTRTG